MAVLAGLALLPLFSACASDTGFPVFERPQANGERVQSSPSASATPSSPAIADGTVVATGELSSLDGGTTGHVSVTATATPGRFDITISELHSPLLDQQAVINFSTEPFDEEHYCSDAFMTFGGGNQPLESSMSSDLRLDTGQPSWINPDFIDTLVLTHGDVGQPATGCYYPVIATAALDWALPDFRPDLVVADSGATGLANGTVELHDGRPGSYKVASGDILTEIAARFGVTVADLHYLNPTRHAWEEDMAYAEEVLNLDKSRR